MLFKFPRLADISPLVLQAQQGKSEQAAATFKQRAQEAGQQAKEAGIRATIATEQAKDLHLQKLTMQAAAAEVAAAGFSQQAHSLNLAVAAAHTDANSATAAARDAGLRVSELEAASTSIDHEAVRQVLQGARVKVQEAVRRGAGAWQNAALLRMEVRAAWPHEHHLAACYACFFLLPRLPAILSVVYSEMHSKRAL